MADRKYVSSNCEKHIVLWARKICWPICFHPYSDKLRLRKDEFSRQQFRKISQTLYAHVLLRLTKTDH